MSKGTGCISCSKIDRHSHRFGKTQTILGENLEAIWEKKKKSRFAKWLVIVQTPYHLGYLYVVDTKGSAHKWARHSWSQLYVCNITEPQEKSIHVAPVFLYVGGSKSGWTRFRESRCSLESSSFKRWRDDRLYSSERNWILLTVAQLQLTYTPLAID